jgi:hypothetical protein
MCGFGVLVFQMSSASFVWGIEDIVGAEFSTVFDEDGNENKEISSWHMGLLFSAIGAGCMTGPAVMNLFTTAQKPYTLQRACIVGLGCLTGGWLAISTAKTFPQFLVYTFFRTMGSGIVWVNSTLLLQALSEPQLLGRVLAVEYTLVTIFEASSATMSGYLNDNHGYDKNDLAFFGASLGIATVTFWGTYYWFGLGAAHARFNPPPELLVVAKPHPAAKALPEAEEDPTSTIMATSTSTSTSMMIEQDEMVDFDKVIA